MSGKIKNIFEEKQYSFITAEDGKDYFFHSSDLVGKREDWEKCRVGGLVTFFPATNFKGLRAENVLILN